MDNFLLQLSYSGVILFNVFLTLIVYNVNNLIVIYFYRSSGTRVYVGFNSPLVNTVEEAAVKVLPTDGNKKKALKERNNETKILVRISHINIVAYYVRVKTIYSSFLN